MKIKKLKNIFYKIRGKIFPTCRAGGREIGGSKSTSALYDLQSVSSIGCFIRGKVPQLAVEGEGK